MSKQILVSTLVLGASVINLAACGQSGALYLPPPTATTKPTAAAPAGSPAPAAATTPSSQPTAP